MPHFAQGGQVAGQSGDRCPNAGPPAPDRLRPCQVVCREAEALLSGTEPGKKP